MGKTIEFPYEQGQVSAYFAGPEGGSGPGVLLVHAWWGLNDFFRSFSDRLAAEGFVVLAPDLFGGRVAATIGEAEALVKTANDKDIIGRIQAAVDYLRGLPAVTSKTIGAVGFSFGAAWSLWLSTARAGEVGAVVVFYGAFAPDFSTAKAAYLGHFAPGDEWEPDEGVRELEQALQNAGLKAEFHRYPGASHWFMEDNRPEAFHPQSAQLAWERTVEFLHMQLDPMWVE